MPDRTTPTAPSGPFHFDFDQIDWAGAGSGSTKAPAEMVAQAKRLGARRKKIATGECGFFMNYSTLPAGYHIAPHSHGHAELIMVIEGGATVHGSGPDDTDIVLDQGDSIVIDAGFNYSITCGDDGMNFVTIRTEDSQTQPS